MRKKVLLFLILSFPILHADAQKAKLIAGPMIGHTTENSTRIWIGYKGKSNNVVFLFDSLRREIRYPMFFDPIHSKKGEIALTMDFKNLRPDTRYNLLIKIGNDKANDAGIVHTMKESNVEDFSFIAGSCFLIMPHRLGKWLIPGKHMRIFKAMNKEDADMNLWLGDNTYYIWGQWKNYERMFWRQMTTRSSNPLYNSYMLSRPNYSIWDDHDYGPNNSDSSFVLKDTSLNVFTHFWANPPMGKERIPGVFYSFKKYDTEFFMTDDRYYRSPDGTPNGHMLGSAQMQWLKVNLMLSSATFKFIVVGSQALNPCTDKECWITEYPAEIKDLLDFIKRNKIPGVIFLSGDRHATTLWKNTQKDYYPFYELMCSPVLSFLSKFTDEEKANKDIVPGTMIEGKRNYGKISIEGKPGERQCVIRDLDEYGKLLWEYKISENELKAR